MDTRKKQPQTERDKEIYVEKSRKHQREAERQNWTGSLLFTMSWSLWGPQAPVLSLTIPTALWLRWQSNQWAALSSHLLNFTFSWHQVELEEGREEKGYSSSLNCKGSGWSHQRWKQKLPHHKIQPGFSQDVHYQPPGNLTWSIYKMGCPHPAPDPTATSVHGTSFPRLSPHSHLSPSN